MSQRRQTPDERFLIKIYETAMERGDPFLIVDYRGAAQAVGLKETALKNIIKHLAQAYFVRKEGETALFLTQRGCDFVLECMESL